MTGKSHFEKTVLLSIGHLAVVIAGFLVPIFLSRWLTIDDYGTYKQLMLFHVLALFTAHMGMDNGLFYFVKSHPRLRGIFSLNVMRFDFFLAAVLMLLVWIFARPLAHLFNNPALAHYLPWFALFTGLSIPTQHFEHYLAVLDDVKQAIFLAVAYEAIKAFVIVGGFFWFNSLDVVIAGLVGLSLAKGFWMLTFNLREMRRGEGGWKDARSFLPQQIRFALPQGATNLINSALKLDKFVISGMFSVRQFTLYAVGCFEIPLIGSVSNTMTDLMSFEMVEARRRKEHERLPQLWRSTLRKVSLFQIPICVYFFAFATPTIVFVFSETYRASADYFRVFTIILVLTGFSSDILFRVFAKTHLLLRLQSCAAVLSLLLVLGSAYFGGPMGALVGKLVADVMTLGWCARHARRMLGVTLAQYLPWKQIGGIALLSVLCAAITHTLLTPWITKPFWLLATSFSLYTALVFLAAIPTRILHSDELQYLVDRVRVLRRIPQSS